MGAEAEGGRVGWERRRAEGGAGGLGPLDVWEQTDLVDNGLRESLAHFGDGVTSRQQIRPPLGSVEPTETRFARLKFSAADNDVGRSRAGLAVGEGGEACGVESGVRYTLARCEFGDGGPARQGSRSLREPGSLGPGADGSGGAFVLRPSAAAARASALSARLRRPGGGGASKLGDRRHGRQWHHRRAVSRASWLLGRGWVEVDRDWGLVACLVFARERDAGRAHRALFGWRMTDDGILCRKATTGPMAERGPQCL